MKRKLFTQLLTGVCLLFATFLQAETIAGHVWNDLNNNGLQDAGEPGLGSVWVQVETPTGGWVAGGFTNMDGDYSFAGIAPGQYKVKVANPGNGFNSVSPNVGTNDAIDSDVSIYGFSDVFTLAAGQTADVDGGLSTGGQCYTAVTATTGNVVCNGSTFTFQITATGGTMFGGVSWGWNYVAGGLSMKPYGQPVTVGPFPCGSPAVVTIVDVDNTFCSATVTVNSPPCCGSGGVPSLTINDVTVNEPAGTATLQICASATSASPMLVQFGTSNGSALFGSDYTTTNGTATIPAGQTCTTVTFPILDDNIPEPTEVFNVNLTNPTGATISDPLGTVTILDNDQPGGIDCGPVSITASGTSIVITGLTAPIITVQVFNGAWLQVFNQTYTNSPGTVTLPGLANGTYFVKIDFYNAQWSPVCKKEVYVTTPGGNAPTLTINDITVTEGVNPTASLQICASATSTSPMTVQYATSNGSALFGSDYTTTSGTATIAVGQTCTTVTFPILDDNLPEPTEVFNVNLTNPTGATISDPLGTVTILDNDQAPACNLSINISQKICNDHGTSSTSDDTYTFIFTVTGTGTGTMWQGSYDNAYLGVFQFGPTAYGTPITLGPFPAGPFTPGNVFPPIILQNGVDIHLSVSDVQTPSCSKSTTVVSLGPCSTSGGPDCNLITFTPSGSSIVVGGLTAPIILVQAFNASWIQVFNQTYSNSPGTVTIPGLASGTYFIKVDFLNAQWSPLCKKEQYVTVGGSDVTLTCPVNMNVTAVAGANSAIVIYPTPTASTTCAGGAVTIVRTSGPASGSSFPVGTTQICHQATDNCGNVKTCCFTVTVTPTTPTDVTLTCPVNMNVTAVAGANSAIVFYPTPTASTTCAGGAVTIARTSGPASGSSFPLGTTQICHQATDNCGNVKTCCFTVTVTSTPSDVVLICPVNMSATAVAGANSANVTYPTPTASTTCAAGGLNVVRTTGPASGSAFPIGTTQVCFTATDACGNSKTCCFTVTVTPSTSTLTFACPINMNTTVVTGTTSATVFYPTPTATTTCPDGMTSVAPTSGPASGSAFPVGTTTVCFLASDHCLNSKTCCFTVTVTPCPVPTSSYCFISPTKPYVNAQITTVDNGSTLTIRTTFSKEFVDNTYGTNAIGWPNNKHNFSDLVGSDHVQLALFNAGGTKSLEFKVDYITSSNAAPSGYKSLGVTGGEGQMLTGSASNIVSAITSLDKNLNQFGYSSYLVNSPATNASYTPNAATPNWIYEVWYEVVVLKTAFGAGGFGHPEITSVHASPSKTGNNTEVVSPTPCPPAPVCGPISITCTADMTTAITSGTSANVSYATPTGTTTCAGGGLTFTRTSGPASGSSFPVGTTQVCYQAMDACGNVKSCCFNVSVCVGPANAVCFVSPTKPYVKAKIVTTDNGSTVTIRTTFSKEFVDNTYGTTAIGWSGGHKFGDLVSSDHVQLALYNGAGTKSLEFKIDYISASSGTPSGYKCLGVTGGEGQMLTGSASSIVSAITSFDLDLNQFGYGSYTTNSPATDANYTPNPATPNWIYDVWYEVVVQKSAFGASGFGNPLITNVHASPSKTGSNTEVVNVTPCPPGNGCSTAPLILQQDELTFNASRAGFDVNLKWVSTTGERNDYFIVERSRDLHDWSPIEKIQGEGAKGQSLFFEAVDPAPGAGFVYYRLTLVFKNGATQMTDPQLVFIPGGKDFAVFPNPASQNVFVSLGQNSGKLTTLRLVNPLGIVVRSVEISAAASLEPVSLDLAGLPGGWYVVSAQTADGRAQVAKLMVEQE